MLHGDAVASVGEFGQVAVRIVGEAPRFGRLDRHQLSVGVVRVVFDVDVRLEAHVARVGPRLVDATLSVVVQFHAEDFDVVQRQRRLGRVHVAVEDAREDGRSVKVGRFVETQARHFELTELFQRSALGLVAERRLGQDLTADATFDARYLHQRIVGVDETEAGQSRFGSVLGLVFEDDVVVGDPLRLRLEIAIHDADERSARRVAVVDAPVAADLFGQSRLVVAVDDASRFARKHDEQSTSVRVVVFDVSVPSAAASRRHVHQFVVAH